MKCKPYQMLLLAMLFSCKIFSQTVKTYSLDDLLALSKKQSSAIKILESIKENKFFQFKNWKADLKPQLALRGNVADFSRDFFGVRQPDGTLVFQPRIQNYSSLGLSLSQRVGSTGGTIGLNSSLTRFDDFDRNEKQYSGIPINLNLSQPIFSFNPYKWEKKIEPLKVTESEREFQFEQEKVFLETTIYFFNVIDAQADYELSKKNQENQQVIFEIESKRINLGTTTRDRMLQIELQLLKLQQDVSKAKVDFQTSLLALKNQVGIKDTMDFRLSLPIVLPKVDMNENTAIALAKKNRPEFISFARRKLEAERDLEQSKKSRFKSDLFVSYGFNNIGRDLSGVYKSPNSQQALSLGITLPILDWGRTQDRIALAGSNLKTLIYTLEQEENNLFQEIRNLVKNMKLIAGNIEVAKQADVLAYERYVLVNEQFRYGKISVNDFNIALNEKDNAKRAFISTLRTFWQSYYKLRSLVLVEI